MIDALINGVNLRTEDGFILSSRPGAWGSPDRVTPTASLYGGRRIVTQADPVLQPRTISLIGTLRGDSAADLRAKRDRLLFRARNGEVEVSFTDDAFRGRVFLARLSAFTPAPPPAEVPATHMPFTIGFDLVHPFLYSALLTVDEIRAVAMAIPLGSEVSRLIEFRVTGAAVDPAVVYENAVGDEIGRLTLSADGAGVNLTAAQHLDMEMETGSIVDQAGTSRQDARTRGSTWPLVLDPAHGDRLRVTSGSLRVRYRKAW